MPEPRKSTEEKDLEMLAEVKGYGSRDTQEAAKEELRKRKLEAMKKLVEKD